MAKCSNCGAELQPNQKFCVECGAKVDLLCAKCGAKLELKYKFCVNCGAPVKGKEGVTQDTPKNSNKPKPNKKAVSELRINELERIIMTISFAESTWLGDINKPAVEVLMYEDGEIVDFGFFSTFDIEDFDPDDFEEENRATWWDSGDNKNAKEFFDDIFVSYSSIICETRSVCNNKFSLAVYNADQKKIYSCNKRVK